MNRTTKYQKLNRPLKRPIPFVELWKPGELVRPATIPDELRTTDFFLGDFGLATKLDDPTFHIQRGLPPAEYCSPDRLHGEDPSFACDMWSYMILFAHLYLGFPPFYPRFDGGILGDLVEVLGLLPGAWKGLCEYPGTRDSWYDEKRISETSKGLGTPDSQGTTSEGRNSIRSGELKARIAMRRPDVDQEERDLVESIMLKVFVFSAERRPTATQLLQDNNFRMLMNKYGC